MDKEQITIVFEDFKRRLRNFEKDLEDINTNPKGLEPYKKDLSGLAIEANYWRKHVDKLNPGQQKEFVELDKDIASTQQAISNIVDLYPKDQKITLGTITNLKNELEKDEKRKNVEEISKKDISETRELMESLEKKKPEPKKPEKKKELSSEEKERIEKAENAIKIGKKNLSLFSGIGIGLFIVGVLTGSGIALAIAGAVALVSIGTQVKVKMESYALDKQKEDLGIKGEQQGRGR